jgi:hypothetical protein
MRAERETGFRWRDRRACNEGGGRKEAYHASSRKIRSCNLERRRLIKTYATNPPMSATSLCEMTHPQCRERQ